MTSVELIFKTERCEKRKKRAISNRFLSSVLLSREPADNLANSEQLRRLNNHFKRVDTSEQGVNQTNAL